MLETYAGDLILIKCGRFSVGCLATSIVGLDRISARRMIHHRQGYNVPKQNKLPFETSRGCPVLTTLSFYPGCCSLDAVALVLLCCYPLPGGGEIASFCPVECFLQALAKPGGRAVTEVLDGVRDVGM